jgi:hypothetical protein
MSVESMLLHMARKVVEQVLEKLSQLLNKVQDEAALPIRAAIQQVVNGVWVGRGADAFVDEVSNLVLPGIGRVGTSIQGLHTNVQSARDVIDRADEELNGLVDSRLNDAFKFY